MLLAYHGDPALKAAMLADMAAQREAGAFVQKGPYWKDGRGGAIGCLVRSEHHIASEARVGFPVALARLLDAVFYALPPEEARAWPERFLSAIEPGADLSRIGWQFLHWILTDEAVNPGIADPLVREAVADCAEVIAAVAAGAPIDPRAAERVHGEAIDAARAAVAALEEYESWTIEWHRIFAAKEAAWSAAAAAESLEYVERPDSSARAVGEAAGCALRGVLCADSRHDGQRLAAERMAEKLIALIAEASTHPRRAAGEPG